MIAHNQEDSKLVQSYMLYINTCLIGYQANKSKSYLHVTNMAKTTTDKAEKLIYGRRMTTGSRNDCKK